MARRHLPANETINQQKITKESIPQKLVWVPESGDCDLGMKVVGL